jgi:N utilization substance protein B
MRRRTKARIWALQILYANEITGEALQETFDSFFKDRTTASMEKREYTRRLLKCYDGHRKDVDRMIEDSVSNWRIERLSMIDRNILRIGISELLFLPDIPEKVSIDEAINLSHIFGGNDSPRFVNGVLDSILRLDMKAT